jgi:uncharacterized membrane protein
MVTLLNRNHHRKYLFLMMLFFTFVCMLIGGMRVQITGNLKGLFLLWNLFLAWIPFIVAFSLSNTKEKIPLLKLVAYLFIWLLFLPNAPYIITDFVHLRPRDGVPLWYDGITIFIFAFHGLMLGIVSTLFIHEALEKYITKIKIWTFLLISFVLTGYGIYLGRFLRWNSWDIIANPIDLLSESFVKLTNPLAIVVTGIFSIIMFFTYLIFYQLIHLKNSSDDTKNI